MDDFSQFALADDQSSDDSFDQFSLVDPQNGRDSSGVAIQAAKGVNDGLANLAGLPVDAMSAVMNLGIAGINQLGGNITPITNPAFGSEDLKNNNTVNSVLGAFGSEPLATIPEPDSFGEDIARIGGGLVPAITSGVGLARALPQTTGLASRVAQNAGVGAADGIVFNEAETAQGELTNAAVGAVLGPIGGEASAFFTRRSEIKDKALDLLSNSQLNDVRAVRFNLSESGDLVADNLAVKAIDQGFDEGTVALVKGSSRSDKSKMLEMIDVVKKGRNNKRFSVLNRPSDIVGESLSSRISVVNKANTEAGQKLDGVAKSLKGQSVDTSSAVDSFIDDLTGIGVDFNPSNAKVSFNNSDLEGLDDLQNIVNRVVRRARDTRTPDAFDTHRLKRFIDQQVTFGKSAKGLSGQVETILKSFRRNLDTSLDDAFPEYDTVNTVYSETIGVLDDFQKSAGKSINLKSENANKAIGTVSRRLLSNAQSRTNLLDSIENLQSVATRNGGNFDDDIIKQVVFVDELESIFDAGAKTSLKGDVAKAISQAPQRSGIANATNAVKTGIDRFKGIDFDSQVDSISELLRK